MVRGSELSDTEVRFGSDHDDPAGASGYYFRAYWASGCDK